MGLNHRRFTRLREIMARTQAADYEQRREAIIDEAAKLFARSGFNGASVAELAAACDTSKSLIYHYYPSKEDILYEVMASHIDRLADEVAIVSACDESPEVKLRMVLRNFMSAYMGAANRHKVLLNELSSLPPEKRAIIVSKQRSIVEAVQRLLLATRPDIVENPARARALTMLLFGMINWTHTWFEPAGPLSPTEIADMSFDLVAAPRY